MDHEHQSEERVDDTTKHDHESASSRHSTASTPPHHPTASSASLLVPGGAGNGLSRLARQPSSSHIGFGAMMRSPAPAPEFDEIIPERVGTAGSTSSATSAEEDGEDDQLIYADDDDENQDEVNEEPGPLLDRKRPSQVSESRRSSADSTTSHDDAPQRASDVKEEPPQSPSSISTGGANPRRRSSVAISTLKSLTEDERESSSAAMVPGNRYKRRSSIGAELFDLGDRRRSSRGSFTTAKAVATAKRRSSVTGLASISRVLIHPQRNQHPIDLETLADADITSHAAARESSAHSAGTRHSETEMRLMQFAPHGHSVKSREHRAREILNYQQERQHLMRLQAIANAQNYIHGMDAAGTATDAAMGGVRNKSPASGLAVDGTEDSRKVSNLKAGGGGGAGDIQTTLALPHIGPNPRLLAEARHRTHDPAATVNAMVAAYDPFPLLWQSAKDVARERADRKRPERDDWDKAKKDRFPKLAEGVGPAYYMPKMVERHVANPKVVFRNKGSRFPRCQTTSDVAPGSYTPASQEKHDNYERLPFVLAIRRDLGRSLAAPSKLINGSHAMIMRQIGSFQHRAFMGPTALKEAEVPVVPTLLQTTIHRFDKQFLTAPRIPRSSAGTDISATATARVSTLSFQRSSLMP